MSKLRNSILAECCEKKIHVSVFVTNGFQLKGHIVGFDDDTVVLSQYDDKQMIISSNAISTIAPEQPISVS